MISHDIQKKIQEVAANTEVQMAVIGAMFHECERGTDLWEALEESSHKFPKEIRQILWGEGCDEEEDEDDETEYIYFKDGLYGETPPHEVITTLIDAVEESIRIKLTKK